MLLRGQNLLGYRHYADDVVEAFVQKSQITAWTCSVFDALNDVRNLETAMKAVNKSGKHAQGNLCYTTSPVHTPELFVTMAKSCVTWRALHRHQGHGRSADALRHLRSAKALKEEVDRRWCCTAPTAGPRCCVR